MPRRVLPSSTCGGRWLMPPRRHGAASAPRCSAVPLSDVGSTLFAIGCSSPHRCRFAQPLPDIGWQKNFVSLPRRYAAPLLHYAAVTAAGSCDPRPLAPRLTRSLTVTIRHEDVMTQSFQHGTKRGHTIKGTLRSAEGARTQSARRLLSARVHATTSPAVGRTAPS